MSQTLPVKPSMQPIYSCQSQHLPAYLFLPVTTPFSLSIPASHNTFQAPAYLFLPVTTPSKLQPVYSASHNTFQPIYSCQSQYAAHYLSDSTVQNTCHSHLLINNLLIRYYLTFICIYALFRSRYLPAALAVTACLPVISGSLTVLYTCPSPASTTIYNLYPAPYNFQRLHPQSQTTLYQL
jgi:hypothetical protein